MNNPMHSPARNRGIALVVALLLLLILTMLGVASMSGVTMQERMASNANLQALAFEAASVGVTETLEWATDRSNWPAGDDGDPVECIRGQGDFLGPWVPGLGDDGDVLNIPGIPDGFRVEYRKRMACFEDSRWETLTDSDQPPPQQLLALSRGEVVRESDDAVLAVREVEVRLEERGGDPTCVIQTGPLDRLELEMPNSGSFEIDARPHGCPIKTSRPEDAAEMRRQLQQGGRDRLSNYQPTNPGITDGPLEGAWGNPEHLARAVNATKIGVRAYEEWESAGAPDNAFANCAGRLDTGNQNWGNPNNCGSTDTAPGGLIYVAGDVQVAGNCVLHSTIISEGGYYSNGTPAYLGDMMYLGGGMEIGGFGQADNSGLFLLHNLLDNTDPNSHRIAYDPDNALFGESDFVIDGGGNATIRPRACESLTDAWEALNVCLDDLQAYVESTTMPPEAPFPTTTEFDAYMAFLEWDPDEYDVPDLQRSDEDQPVRYPLPDCDPEAGGRRFAIASWREFIDRGRWDN